MWHLFVYYFTIHLNNYCWNYIINYSIEKIPPPKICFLILHLLMKIFAWCSLCVPLLINNNFIIFLQFLLRVFDVQIKIVIGNNLNCDWFAVEDHFSLFRLSWFRIFFFYQFVSSLFYLLSLRSSYDFCYFSNFTS